MTLDGWIMILVWGVPSPCWCMHSCVGLVGVCFECLDRPVLHPLPVARNGWPREVCACTHAALQA